MANGVSLTGYGCRLQSVPFFARGAPIFTGLSTKLCSVHSSSMQRFGFYVGLLRVAGPCSSHYSLLTRLDVTPGE